MCGKSYLSCNGVGLDSPLAECSVYGDLTCSVHTVNNLCLFNCQWHAYLCNWRPYVRLAYTPNMLSSWNTVIIIIITTNFAWPAAQHVRDLCFYFRLRPSLYSQIMQLDMTYRIGNQSSSNHHSILIKTAGIYENNLHINTLHKRSVVHSLFRAE